MKKILYLLIMIVSLSFMVSASPPALTRVKISKIPLRGKKIYTKKVSPKGKGYRYRTQSKTNKKRTFTTKPRKIKDFTPRKNTSGKKVIQKEYPSQPSVDRKPLMGNLGSFPKGNYKKTQIFSEEIAEWIHSAEVYHTLLELLEALYELGSDSDSDSDSSDDSDEDGYTYSDTIVVDSTKAVQVVLYLKPINLQQ